MLLVGDHNRVRGLFKRFKTAEEAGDMDTAKKLADEIFTELEVHSKIEEKIFYPACREVGVEELTDVVSEGVEEHHVVDQLMAEIRQLTPDDEAWASKLKVLIENVEHHAEEEEKDMFPKARRPLGEKLKTLAEEMEALKKTLGAPTLADKIDLTESALQELASKQEIPGRSSMSKEELAAAVAPK